MTIGKPFSRFAFPLAFAAALLYINSNAFSRQQAAGEIFGMITSQSSGEKLVGINVSVVGTTLGAATDVDGKYAIRRIAPGLHDVKVSGVGYATKTITGVDLVAGKQTELNVSLDEETYNMKEVVVTADEIRSSENAVLANRKRSSTISDGVSAEQIKRTPDATSGDALKRVTGLSVVDNKFVFIRGIPDRYNETTLDGASVTSTEAGKKSFSFDLLPSNLLDNTSVVKSATPDLPGDFSGGLVQLNTLDFPSNAVVKLNLGSSSNTVSTNKGFFGSQSGSKDWLGFDDGSRAYPGDQPDGNQIARNAPNNWGPRFKTTPYNGSFSLAAGDRIDFDAENSSGGQLGMIGALSYKDTYQKNQKTIDDYEIDRYITGEQDDYSVLWGALANLSYKISGLSKISFKNNFNQSGVDEVQRYRGPDVGNGLENIYTVINWTQRSSYTGQLTGEHTFPGLGGASLMWRGAVSSSHREDPDRKEIVYYQPADDPTVPFSAATSQRSWASLNDKSRSFGFDISLPVLGAKVKLGSLIESKTTDYKIRYFNITAHYPGADSLVMLPLDVIYQQDHFGPKTFSFSESSKPTDSYDGDRRLYAGYVMADIPFSVFNNNFRVTGGARLENDEVKVYVPRTNVHGGPVFASKDKNVDILPSVNFTCLASDMMNVRFAYSQSVNRPEFRELSTTSFYDFIAYELLAGNPDLKRAFVHNYDVRLELFPDIGELFAVSYFSKVINNAIEQALILSATRERTWFNSGSAANSGWELEFRKSLRFLGGYFGNFLITGNYSRIDSRVEVVDVVGTSTSTHTVISTRPLQGQSPYMVNVSFLFTEPHLGTSLSVLYNKFGARLDAVGFQSADVYEQPRDLVDLAISQPIWNLVEAKFTIKNLNDKDQIYTRADRIYKQISMGKTYALQISCGL